MCHLHPKDCHCEQCPCPGLTAAAPYPYPFVDPYREQHLYRGLSNLGPGNYWAAPPLDPRVAARQAGKGVDVSVLMVYYFMLKFEPRRKRIQNKECARGRQADCMSTNFRVLFLSPFSWNGVRESARHFAVLPPEGGGHGLAAVRPLRAWRGLGPVRRPGARRRSWRSLREPQQWTLTARAPGTT